MSLAALEKAIPLGALLLLDSTAVISHFKGSEPVSPVADQVIDGFVRAGRNPALLSSITAMEVLVDPLRRQDEALYHQVVFFLTQTPNLRLVPTDLQVASQAAHCRAHYGLKPPDALIVGSGLAGGARFLICNDREWKTKLERTQAPLQVCHLEDYLPFP